MDSFESLVASLLETEGFWVRSSYKVELTKREKIAIGRPSSPRWEIDLLGYKPADNELFVIECKSYLDSPGVDFNHLFSRPYDAKSRYKLFRERKLRTTVFSRIVRQLKAKGSIRARPKITLCLAAAKIRSASHHLKMQSEFSRRGWLLFDDEWVRTRLNDAATRSYENNVASVVAKMLLRPGQAQSANARGRGKPQSGAGT